MGTISKVLKLYREVNNLTRRLQRQVVESCIDGYAHWTSSTRKLKRQDIV